MARVAPYVNGQGWDYEVYFDPNGDLKRAMNVNNVPHTFLLNGKGEIVYQHNNYEPGDEKELYAKVKALSESSTWYEPKLRAIRLSPRVLFCALSAQRFRPRTRANCTATSAPTCSIYNQDSAIGAVVHRNG